jgi:hypothetical protein
MKPEISPLRISIVDFTAVFMPGTVWLTLIVTAFQLIYNSPRGYDVSPFSAATDLIGVSQDLGSVTNHGLPFYVALAVLAVLAGAATNRLVEFAEYVAYPEHWRPNSAGSRFPFHLEHSNAPYFCRITDYIDSALSVSWTDLPGHKPFSTCRRLLKALNPNLWEECERVEAEVRMLGSLFLAGVVSLVLGIVKGVFSLGLWRTATVWCIGSSIAVVLLCAVFRIARKREVKYVYLLTIIATAIADPLTAVDEPFDTSPTEGR